jgi:hypothetical protein
MGHTERMEWLVVEWPNGGRTWHVDDEDGEVLAELLDQLPDDARLYRVSGPCTITTVEDITNAGAERQHALNETHRSGDGQ